jgi:hypothetical protein
MHVRRIVAHPTFALEVRVRDPLQDQLRGQQREDDRQHVANRPAEQCESQARGNLPLDARSHERDDGDAEQRDPHAQRARDLVQSRLRTVLGQEVSSQPLGSCGERRGQQQETDRDEEIPDACAGHAVLRRFTLDGHRRSGRGLFSPAEG